MCIRDRLSDEQLLEIRNLGPGALAEIRQNLDKYLIAHPEHRPPPPEPEPEPPPPGSEVPQLSPSIKALELSARAYNGLHQKGIDTIAQLLALSDREIMAMRNIGGRTLAEIRLKLKDFLGQHPECRVLAPDAAAKGTQQSMIFGILKYEFQSLIR